MTDQEVATIGGEKALAVERWLRELGWTDRDVIGSLSADLGDLYAHSSRCQRLLDEVLSTTPADGDRAGQRLSDLREELRHLGNHIRSGLRGLDRAIACVNGEDGTVAPGTAVQPSTLPRPLAATAQERVHRPS